MRCVYYNIHFKRLKKSVIITYINEIIMYWVWVYLHALCMENVLVDWKLNENTMINLKKILYNVEVEKNIHVTYPLIYNIIIFFNDDRVLRIWSTYR